MPLKLSLVTWIPVAVCYICQEIIILRKPLTLLQSICTVKRYAMCLFTGPKKQHCHVYYQRFPMNQFY